MDRSLYPEGVEVHAAQLQNSEDSKAFHIQRRFADETRSGRASGLAVVIGTPTSRFTIGAGYGYTSRGDYVESAGSVNIPLADYTSGVENLIVLVYRENLVDAEAHEDGGATRNTLAQRSSELKVVTRAEYASMAASADGDFATNLKVADLTTDAQDRIVIVASVLGKGFVGPTPNGYIAGDFTNGNITQQALFPTILSAALPTSPTITGMNIRSISSNTLLGAGTLQLNGTAGAYRLSWFSPAADGTSTPTVSPTGVTFGNSSLIQTFTITTEPHSPPDAVADASTITVEVLTDLMPQGGTPFDDVVTVARYYDDTGAAFSVRDELHRSKIGSYVPTPRDAHGMGFPDFDQQMAVIPQPTLIGTGALGNNAQALESRITTPRSVVGGVHRTLMWQLTGGAYVTRFYKTDADIMEITTNSRWDGTNWVKDTTSAGVLATKFQMGSNGLSEFVYTGSPSPFADSSFAQSWASDAFNITTPRQGMLRLGEGFLLGNDVLNPRIRARYNGGPRVLMWESTNLGGGLGGARIFIHTGTYEIVLNASWDGANWTQDDSGSTSTKTTFNGSSIVTQFKAAAGGSWNDSSWDDVAGGNIQIDTGAGTIVTKGSIQSGQQIVSSALSTTNDTQARYFATIDPSGSPKRFLLDEVQITGSAHWRKYLTFPVGSPYAHTEETFNCRWTGTQWDYDSVGFGAATLWRFGYPYTFVITKDGGGSHPWADTPAVVHDSAGPHVGGFSRLEYHLGHNGGGLFLPSQIPVGTPPANTLFGNNIAKAWASITITNVSTVPVFTVNDSFNVDTVTPAGTNLVIAFLQAMGSANYVVKANLASLPVSLSSNPTIVDIRPHGKTSSNFDLSMITRDGNLASFAGFDVTNNGLTIDFAVYGGQ